MAITRRQLLRNGTVIGAAATLPMTPLLSGTAFASSDPYIGEIMIWGGTFNPLGWAFCDGALMSIAENSALFTLIGTTYGGDGEETFGLPDLQGRLPLHQGNSFVLGGKAGVESVTLTSNQMPVHSHAPAANTVSNQASPAGGVWGGSSTNWYSTGVPATPLAPQAVGAAGGSQPHDNMVPFLALTFVIALEGVFPSQN